MASPSYRIVEYDDEWPALFKEEKARVVDALGIEAGCVEHIGSTSVPGLGAKPIVDIMVGIPSMNQADEFIPSLERIDYEWRDDTVPGTRYIRKEVPRRYNLHMTRHGGDFWVEHLLFRNYLRAHSHVARRYEELKCDLMAAYASEPRTYNQGKSEFIQAIVEQARAER